jgi:hypothetical protein
VCGQGTDGVAITEQAHKYTLRGLSNQTPGVEMYSAEIGTSRRDLLAFSVLKLV